VSICRTFVVNMGRGSGVAAETEVVASAVRMEMVEAWPVFKFRLER
jgi:hypothetical protein